jgi:hypothetical protein
MNLHIHMTEIADRDSLPSNHPLREAATVLGGVLSRKGEKDFLETLFEAETNALAAYAAYTGKAFVDEED